MPSKPITKTRCAARLAGFVADGPPHEQAAITPQIASAARADRIRCGRGTAQLYLTRVPGVSSQHETGGPVVAPIDEGENLMRRSIFVLAAAVIAAAFGTHLDAQKTTPLAKGGGGSPHERTEWTIKGANISIEYGRPFVKGRALKEVAPYGSEWRTGSDQATTLKTDKALTFGSLHVPAGTYTIYTVPGDKEWQLVISKKTGQWGIPYPAGQDLGRTPMTAETLSTPTTQLTIAIEPTANGGTLRVQWGTTGASVAFTVG
jgi:hypothetical protein